MKRTMAILTVVLIVIATFASPAQAARYNDSFWVCALERACVDFVDAGEGWPGGGDNDDYVVIHDYYADGYGTKAYAWLNGDYLGWKYNGNGYAGDPVLWDPFAAFGDVHAGDYVGLKVCLSDGPGDPNTFENWCTAYTQRSHDG
ncbi:hypothetical protein ACIA5D_49870 [Actinoplanes sp. NPDC051513]|uniref:hypothetical protein n=1 Tax=Actinoplanes sp. NPDC051513 TaxID=3363908 RepID=UPI0037AA94CB